MLTCLVCVVYLVCLVCLVCLVISARKSLKREKRETLNARNVESEKACLPATLPGAFLTIGQGRQEIVGGPAAGRVQGFKGET